MSAQVYEDPVMLDSTGLAMVTKLEAIKNAVQPVNAGTDIDLLIPSSGWTSSSPYQYTYTNSHITSGCMVKVNFLEGNNYTTPLYLNFEKITNGIIFTAPTKPTNNISVRVHIFSADTTSTTATNAEAVSTSAVSGANNVEDALGSLSNHIVLLDNTTRHTRKTDFSLSDLQAAVVDQNLELHGLQVGDQKTINGHTYVIAGLNVMKGTYDYTCTSNHVGLIVITHTAQAWNASGSTVKTSDGSDNRGGGYKNCDLQYYLANTVMGFCNTDLGSSHLYQHKKLFGNAVNATGYNRFGTNTGCTSECEWVDAYISALTEAQVFGGDHWSSSGYDTGEANTLLPVFAKYKHTEIFGGEYPWLRNVSSASQACIARNTGLADGAYGVSGVSYVAGLILYH